MRIALISDIHSNLEALNQVLADIKRAQIKSIFCLGDFVGYGPQPNEVVDVLRSNNIICIKGNHEHALFSKAELSMFNSEAAASIAINKKLISPPNLKFIKSLPRTYVLEDVLLVHACPPKSISRYVNQLSKSELKSVFRRMKEPLAFIGHTHELAAYSFDGIIARKRYMIKPSFHLNPLKKYIISSGSVGQPRDGNNKAKYLIYDIKQRTVMIKQVKYDVQMTMELIKKAGLPEANAERLLF